MPTRHRLAGLAFCLLCLTLAGCGKSAPTRFYTLTTPAGGQSDADAAAPAAHADCPVLGIGPVDWPAYLDRTQIVTRGETSSMHLAEFDQWIEPAHDNFERALLENLAGMLGGRPVISHPWPAGMHPDRQVAVQVRRFDGVMGREAVLRAEWSVLDADGRLVLWRQAVLREPVQGQDYTALVAAQSRLVAAFAAQIAQGLDQGTGDAFKKGAK